MDTLTTEPLAPATERHYRWTHDMRTALITAVMIAATAMASSCLRTGEPTQLSPAGAETWKIDGHDHQLSSTHYERRGRYGVAYVMTYAIPTSTSATIVTADKAALLSLPLIKYAHDRRSFERAQMPPLKAMTAPPVSLVVDLLSASDRHLLYRYEVPAGEVTWRLMNPTAP